MSDPSFWQGPTTNVPVVNADGNIFEEAQVAAGAQTVFTLLTFTYTPNTHSIFVYRKTAADAGVGSELLRRGVDYTETASNKITLAAGAVAGDILIFIAYAIQQIIPPIVFNGMPAGGTAGQQLVKNSGNDYDTSWSSANASTSLLDAPRVNIASASTVSLTALAATTRNIQITGNIQLDGFQISNGQVWAVKFASTLTLKNNANIVTNSGSDIAVTANSTCFIRAIADNVVEILSYKSYGGDTILGSINGGQIGGLRNRLINPTFNINQLAVASPVTLAAGIYGHDGWKAGAAGCTYSFAVVGNKTVITITAGSLQQVVEDISVEGGFYTLSNQGTAQARIAVNGAAPAGAYANCPQVSVTATAKQAITVEFTTGTIDRPQLEYGTQATYFSERPLQIEQELCYRYAYLFNGCFAGVCGAAGGEGSICFKVQMRVPPTMINKTNGTLLDGLGGIAVTGATLATAYVDTARVGVTAAGTTAGRGMNVVGQAFLFEARL